MHRIVLHCYKNIVLIVRVCHVSIIILLPCLNVKGDMVALENMVWKFFVFAPLQIDYPKVKQNV